MEKGKLVLGWLNLKEIDDLLKTAELDDGERNVLEDRKELAVKQIGRKVLYSESPLGAIEAILEIPDKYKIGAEMIDLVKISIRILFTRATKHFSASEVELLGKVLKRMGTGLHEDPWKIIFLEMVQKYFPSNIEKMVKMVKDAGIDEKEYVGLVWKHASEILGDSERLKNKIYEDSSFITKIVAYIDEKISNGSQIHGREFLQAGDTLLAQENVYAACKVYEALKKEQNFLIGDAREKIIEINDSYQGENTFFHLSYERMVRQIKRVIKKSGLAIKIQ